MLDGPKPELSLVFPKDNDLLHNGALNWYYIPGRSQRLWANVLADWFSADSLIEDTRAYRPRSPHFILYDIHAMDPGLPGLIRQIKETHPLTRQVLTSDGWLFDDASIRQMGHARLGRVLTPHSRVVWRYFHSLLSAGADGIQTGL